MLAEQCRDMTRPYLPPGPAVHAGVRGGAFRVELEIYRALAPAFPFW